MPLLVAPTAFHRLADPDGELATARAAAAAGTVMCLSTLSSVTPAELAAAVPGGRLWFQRYWSADRGFTAWAINVYATRPEFRPAIGTSEGLTHLEAS